MDLCALRAVVYGTCTNPLYVLHKLALIYVYYIYVCIHIYIYIYIEREREREVIAVRKRT